jgi:diguanylate cyclase (GGDEF)-like protein/PAS domain S-box-containing protein
MNPSHLPRKELAIAAIFFVVALGSMLMTRVNGGISLIWPANAVAAALLIRSPKVRWLSAAVLLFVAGAVSNATVAHRAWPISIVFSSINTAEIAFTVWMFRSQVRFPYPEISIGQATFMTAVFGIAIPGLSAIAGGAALYGYYGLAFADGSSQWWSSHALGACLVGPPIILWSSNSLRRLVAEKFRAQNFGLVLFVLLGCYASIHYVRFPFVVVGVLLLIAAFRVGGFGAALLSLGAGFSIAALWSLGLRPEGLERTPVVASLQGLPVLALLATVLPAIAVGLGTDARRAAVLRLNVSERRFRESMEHSPIGMLISSLDGVWDYTNIALQEMLGYSAEDLRALPPGGPSEPDEWTQSASRLRRLVSGEIDEYDTERRFRHRDGHWIWTHVAVSVLRDEQGLPQNLIAQIESLEARRQAEANLAAERERLRITLSSIADAVITLDADTRITYINAAAEELLGQRLADLQQRRLSEVMSLTDPQTSKSAADLVGQSRVHGRAVRRETPCVLHRPDGLVRYVRDVASPVLDSQGSVRGIVVVLQDASADLERARDVTHRASHDLLTGLANRFEFQRRLSEVFRRAQHTQIPAAMLAIDLDRFKTVNDIGGHAAGDAMLRRVAEVLHGSIAIRQSDTVARLGGDEFAIILEKCPESRGTLIGQRVLEALNPLQIDWEGRSYEIGASVGLAMITPSFDSEAAWAAAADQACYQAKREGRGRLRVAHAPPGSAGSQAVRTGGSE